MRMRTRPVTLAAAAAFVAAPALPAATMPALAAPTAGSSGAQAVAKLAAVTETDANAARRGPLPGGYKHPVVIYQENHSFDNLYGG